MNKPKWEVGQKVILRERQHKGSRDVSVTIARVGRKYVYVAQGWRERAFEADTGIEKGEGSCRGHIFTAESLAEHDRRTEAERRLAEATRGWSWHRNLSTDDIEAIVAIIERGGA